MANRRALLIGIEDYGDGFGSLPAVREDIKHLCRAMQDVGYETEPCRPDVLANATLLDDEIRKFCASGGQEDVRLIYFTGHGILADGVDWVVPAGVTRKEASASPNQRVSTDLSKTVADSETGLVLFVIDACRDPADAPVTKGGVAWGDSAHVDRPGEPRFIRFFGCAANQVCQVVSTANGEPESSLFTRSLAECILRGDAVSLEGILPKVEQRCAELLKGKPLLQAQAPRLSYGELSSDMQRILKKPVFDRIRTSGITSVWPEFDPHKLHCLVVQSEYEKEKSPDWGLTELVKEAVAGKTGVRIWNAFSAAANNLRLVSDPKTVRRRSPPADFKPSAVRTSVFSVLDAFASGQTLDIAVRAIAEADLVVFDVTDFEPGIMLLVGVRSACRRWLTVCSHGAEWEEGKPLDLPFNIQDLNINSHTPRKSRVGSDPVVERFVCRVVTGFAQAAKQPNYLDLPAYDVLRQLGSHYAVSRTIAHSERILFLCAYVDSFFSNWQFVSSRLVEILSQKKMYEGVIERIIDYGTSQLIRQSLYEQIRRTEACVVDWSEFSASVFLELGARLAVSEWGAIQVIDDRYLPDGKEASKLAQVEHIRRLLGPMPYKYRAKSSDGLEQVVEVLIKRNPSSDGEADYNRIHRSLLAVIGTVQAARPSVVEELRRQADSMHHPDQGRVGVPQVLFHGSRDVKQDSERAALELRIAAWLYLEHRVHFAKLNEDELKSYRELGRSAADALYDLGDDESFARASYIEEKLKQKD